MTQPERGMNEALPRAVLDSKGPESREPRKLPVKHRLGDERENIGRNPEAHGFSRWEEVTDEHYLTVVYIMEKMNAYLNP